MENVRKTCVEMLQQRGYSILRDDEDGLVGEKEALICVFFNESLKLDVERVKEYISLMTESEIHHSIVVFKDSVTPVARKLVEELPKCVETSGYLIELFEASTLRYNITTHRLVPKHTALSKAEGAAFREKFGLKIPVLLKMDPIARFFNFQRGDIIKIERNCGFVSFRIVK